MHSKSFVAVMTSWGSRVGLVRFSGVGIIIRPCLIWWFLWRWSNYCVVATGPRWSPTYSTAESLYLCGKTRRFTHSQFGSLTRVLKSESQFCDKSFICTFIFTLLLLPQTRRDVHGALISFPSGSGDVRPTESYWWFTKIDLKRHRKYRAC